MKDLDIDYELDENMTSQIMKKLDALESCHFARFLEKDNHFGHKYLNAVKKVEDVKFHYWVNDTLRIWSGMVGVEINSEIDPFGLVGGPYIHVDTLKCILSDLEKEYKNDKK